MLILIFLYILLNQNKLIAGGFCSSLNQKSKKINHHHQAWTQPSKLQLHEFSIFPKQNIDELVDQLVKDQKTSDIPSETYSPDTLKPEDILHKKNFDIESFHVFYPDFYLYNIDSIELYHKLHEIRKNGHSTYATLYFKKSSEKFEICKKKKKSIAYEDCIIPNGLYSFVTDKDRDIIIYYGTESNERDNTCASGSHIQLGHVMPVYFAGEIRFSNGYLIYWNNQSGTYQCPAIFAHQAGLPLQKFRPYQEVFKKSSQ